MVSQNQTVLVQEEGEARVFILWEVLSGKKLEKISDFLVSA